MACESRLSNKNQTLTQRKEEIRDVIKRLSDALGRRKVKAVIGPQGAISFQGWDNEGGVTDGCAYRMIMATGSALAKMEIAKAEQLSGRSVNKQAVAAGWHSHDSGNTWDKGH